MAPRKRAPGDEASEPRKKRKAATTQEDSAVTRRVTRHMTTDAARKAVLETHELVDAILQFVPPRQLWALQRVNKAFKTVISATSPYIKQKLFLNISSEADQPRNVWKWDRRREKHFALPPRKPSLGMCRDHWVATLVALNPCLTPRNEDDGLRWHKSGSKKTGILGKTLGKGLIPINQVQQMSIGNAYLSDCPYTNVHCELRIVFGRKHPKGVDPFKVHVSETVQSDSRLTINEVIARTLSNRNRLSTIIYGHREDEDRKQIGKVEPWDFIKTQERKQKFPAFLDLGGSNFDLLNAIAPSDEKKAEVEARAQRNVK